ncbi:MAG: cell wall-active antibiotics response protein, partial [Actinomycetota bacterium]|nr:cell wall-active antibiotics response protein [Actinomycetota bacterium]
AGLLGLLLTAGLGVAGAAVGSEVLPGLRAGRSVPVGLGPVPFTLACALAGVGLALVLIGLLGRRAGFTGLLAVALTALTVAAATVPPFVLSTGTDDRTWRASQPEPAGGYVVGLGDGVLDLSGATPGQQFDVEVGLGDLTVVVPPGVKATIQPSLGMGELAVVHDGGGRESRKPDSGLVVGEGPTTVTIRARLMAGDLTVRQDAAPIPTRTGGAG